MKNSENTKKKKKKKFSKLIENTVAGIMTILKVN